LVALKKFDGNIYGKCMVHHEDIGETCAIVGGPTIFIITKIGE
jgi:hypothetical protein